jgi:hypothetical protein
MSDLELRKYGRAARDLADPKKNFGPPNPSFKIQLDEARTEWRRRGRLANSACSTCKKKFGTMPQFLDHLTDDVLPALLDMTIECRKSWRRGSFCSEKRAAKCLVFFSTGVLQKRHSGA